MKITLINPPHTAIGSRIPKEHLPPLGLLSVGGPLIDAGFAVKLIDAQPRVSVTYPHHNVIEPNFVEARYEADALAAIDGLLVQPHAPVCHVDPREVSVSPHTQRRPLSWTNDLEYALFDDPAHSSSHFDHLERAKTIMSLRSSY